MDADLSLVASLSLEVPKPLIENKLDDFTILEWANYAKKKARIASSTSKELGRLKALVSASPMPADKTKPKQGAEDHVFEQDPWSHSKCRAGHVGSAPCPSGFGSGVQFAPAQFVGASAFAKEDCCHSAATTLAWASWRPSASHCASLVNVCRAKSTSQNMCEDKYEDEEDNQPAEDFALAEVPDLCETMLVKTNGDEENTAAELAFDEVDLLTNMNVRAFAKVLAQKVREGIEGTS